jgi:carbonic anhydrase/acetyltransferase-like protein (isoleucine patch superfamily)
MNTQVRIHPTAVIMGDVRLGNGVSVWPNAVIRGDLQPVTIGDNSNVQDNVVIHVNHGLPTHIGGGVTIGHNATVHGCTVEDNVLIGMGAVILDGAVIGENSIIGAGAVVSPGTKVPPGSLVVGVPGQVKRSIRPEEIESIRMNSAEYVELAQQWLKQPHETQT